jgi:hypothetical protein
MAKPPAEDLETFLRRQDAADLVAVLLELTADHERLEEHKGGWRILGQQLARHLVQPAVEHAAELPRLAMAVEPGRAPPARERLLEAGGELVRPVGQLHAR